MDFFSLQYSVQNFFHYMWPALCFAIIVVHAGGTLIAA